MAGQPELTQDQFLGGRLTISQPRHGYRAATDPVLLAAACPAEAGQSVLELGCGVGVAALCLGARVSVQVTGIELQADYAELARRNARDNGIKLDVVDGDLAQMPETLRARSFDHVMLNPPFFGPGAQAEDPGRARGRQEQTALSVWIDAALRRLKPKGFLTLIMLTERLPEVIVALDGRAGGVAIKPLAPRAGRPAARFILCARKGSRSVASLANPLVLHEGSHHRSDRDDYTLEAKAVLRDGHSLKF